MESEMSMGGELVVKLIRKDIVERLRLFKIATDLGFPIHPDICDEAANEIEQLREQHRQGEAN